MILFFFCTLSVLLLLASLNIESFFDGVDDEERLKMYTAEVATRMSAMQWVIFAYVAGIHLAVSRVAYILYMYFFALCGTSYLHEFCLTLA